MAEKPLREGFTTGSAASAAAKAGTLFLLSGAETESADIPLPAGGRLHIPIHGYSREDEGVLVTVIKDAGDDPDVTHLAAIQCRVMLDRNNPGISLQGGTGVGVVTLPGLPVPVGEPAINPEPRRQILAAVAEALDEQGGESDTAPGVSVTVIVPRGEELAKKTLNPRLGIQGGISILGTRGTVKPFSHEAYEATISQGLNVASAAGLTSIAFATGRRSEKFLMAALPGLDWAAFVQIADFFAFSLQKAVAANMQTIYIGCFFGKLVKMAQGFAYTHANSGPIDFKRLAHWCEDCGLDGAAVSEIAWANTARQVLDIVFTAPQRNCIFSMLARNAALAARHWCPKPVRIEFFLFDFDGGILFPSQSLESNPS